MTYYDTRNVDEAVIGRRKEAAERIQGKTSVSSNAGLSGPRQLERLKRRPLPTDPSGTSPARPSAPEHIHSAPPLHHPQPSRPVMRDHAQTMPPAAGPEPSHHMRYSEHPYEAPSHAPAPSMRPRGMYDGSSEPQRDSAVPALPPTAIMRRNAHELPYPTNEALDDPYDSHPPPPHSQQPDYDHPPPQTHRAASEPPFDQGIHGRSHYDAGAQPHDAYSMVSPQYNVNPMTFGQVSTFSPRSSAYEDEPAPLNYHRPDFSSAPMDDPGYQSHVKALPPATRSDIYHPEYATMQPRVEDEDEDGPPPPPPVHRSRMAQQAQSPHSQSPSSYTPYTPTHSGNPAVPASLVAGYEPEERVDRSVYEDRSGKRRSTHFDDEMMIAQTSAQAPPPAPVPLPFESPVYPLKTSRPIDERPGTVANRGGSASPDNRVVTRKSVSPRPSSSDSQGGSQIPFSPDSYNSLNPHASRPATNRDSSAAYEMQPHAREESVRADFESVRDPDQPIIGDDGREIDPSDHLPTDTWAPEPERKNRKPEVIIRFKHSPRPTSRGNDTTPARSTAPRVGFKSTPDYVADRPGKRYTPTHMQADSVDRTPPRAARGPENYGNYTHGQGYSTPTSAERPRSSHRGSVSPTPGSRSPLYDYSPGPPIPTKVPVSGPPAYPVASSQDDSGRPGIDALSRELSTIDIGSVGCSPSRAVRRYAPRPSATMGYAS